MTTRTFEFSEGTSNKFWTITLGGCTHTVSYGRIGTAGQALTAEFASEAEAQKSHDKLVAEKLKKGYVEKNGDSCVPVTPSASSTGHAVRQNIDLDLWAFSYVPSRRAAPAPQAPARAFDLQDCLTRLRTKVRVQRYGWDWDYSRAIPDRALAPEEAELWLTAMTIERPHGTQSQALADMLETRAYRGTLPEPLNLDGRYVTAHAVQCLAALVSSSELCELLLDPSTGASPQTWRSNVPVLRAGFRRFVLPYLDDTAIGQWRNATKAAWKAVGAWPTANLHVLPAPAFYFGAMLGLHEEVHAVVEQWPDDLYVGPTGDHTERQRPQEFVWGVGSADQVAHQFRRLRLPINTPADLQTFLAITDVVALDIVANTIAARSNKDQAEELMESFARIHTPEAAPHALDLALNSKAPKTARAWLDNHLDEAIVGLMPVAAGKGKLADAATEFLNSMKRRGQTDRITTHLGAVAPDVAEYMRVNVLDIIEEHLPVLSREATPAWWTEALAQAPVKKSKPAPWTSDLPAITLGEHALGPDHVAELLSALQASTVDQPHPLLRPLREHGSPERLDAFGWKLCESWLADGAPSKDKWAFIAAGFLGGDRTALRLAPLVREWPGESQHPRAVLGLEVLRNIGTDTALMQINGIAQKVKFKGLKERAVQCMDAIAAGRNMTRAQLEDRIVPDCGLDARGERQFDFGPRQFRFVLGPELKAMIRYPDGVTRTDLPKPSAKDDAAKATSAVAEWKPLKKQIADVARIQAVRLEQAMVTGRRWSGNEFDQLIVRHPLMVHLARLLVWATYGPSDSITATFRVTEDQTLADASDEPFALPPDASVGVLHPLHLTGQQGMLERWGQIIGDYEIVPPFAQLGRPAYRLTAEQMERKEITHFEARGKLPAQTLVFGLEKLGWQRGVPADAGWVGEHSKQFYGANLTAVIDYEEGFSVGYWEGAGEQTIKRVFFVPGLYTPQMYPEHKNAVRLADVNPIALSEALGDCELLLAKAK
ncbi:MAG TPA: DUF4132 domain-containing protein [Povalibacter sp.]|uniref:WGR and DUF4132 domain-containing protein n=1 Tax=Povalibacter sp. TaxID=1962978 RepID=UPI002BBBC532|nr:DUF4132 domain-containing protein [Povalibacter sp.]HMN46914.1 DUF4132 domain-containing protein [Povalibacter sp.]